MPLETGSFINDLTPSNPPGSDPAGQGDDHIRLIKTTVQGTFPQMGDVFGKVRSQDTAASISSIWNTSHFLCSASATATVVLTLPPSGSVTAGFYVDISTVGTGTVSLLPSGAASINGGASLSIPRVNTARVYFAGGTSWFADVVPNGQNGHVFGGTVIILGSVSISGAVSLARTLSVSGATSLLSTLSVSGAAVLSGALTVAGTTTLSGTVVLSNGQLVFPAVQNASAGANTLDDYEEGTFTPTLTAATPGDINVVYSTRTGVYTKIGNLVNWEIVIVTSTFTWTTASGAINITGLPFAAGVLSGGYPIAIIGLTSSSDQIAPAQATGATLLTFVGTEYGAPASATLSISTMPTGVQQQLTLRGQYTV